jgi:hypothetical protein
VAGAQVVEELADAACSMSHKFVLKFGEMRLAHAVKSLLLQLVGGFNPRVP